MKITMKKFLPLGLLILIVLITGTFAHTAFAGSLTPSAAPASVWFTLDGIYNKLINNTVNATEGAQSFATPGSVSATFHTLEDIYNSIPTLDASKIASGTTYMGVTGTLVAGGLPKTGQTSCWDVSGNPISCTGTGQDGELQEGLPASGSRFTDNGDGTITDNATGLMWDKCSNGQSASDCSGGSANQLDWPTALMTCQADTTGGHSGWRLPNRNELISITNLENISPAIDTTFFPSTQSDDYWSSSTGQDAGGYNNAWLVNFDNGGVDANDKTGTGYVRCVR